MLRRKIKPWPNFKPHVDAAWGKHRTWRERMWSENDPTEDQRYGRQKARGSRRQVLLIRSDIYLGFTRQLLNIRPRVRTQGWKVPQDVQRKQRKQQSQTEHTCEERANGVCSLQSAEQRAHSAALPRLLRVVTKTIKFTLSWFQSPEDKIQSCWDETRELGELCSPWSL